MRAKVQCMKDHSELPLRENTDHFILPVGTNNLYSDSEQKTITKSVVDIDSSKKKKRQCKHLKYCYKKWWFERENHRS